MYCIRYNIGDIKGVVDGAFESIQTADDFAYELSGHYKMLTFNTFEFSPSDDFKRGDD